MKTIEIKEGEFKAGQLLRVVDVDGVYRINRVTDRAILIECPDGKWVDNGSFIPVWLPISQLYIQGVNSNPQNSDNGIHVVGLPAWLVDTNRNKW